MQRFRELRVWQRSHVLALKVHAATTPFPADERFGLVAQLRRAAISVPTNIAEGSKRLRALDYARFLNFAEASLAEVECLLLLSRDLGYIAAESAEPLLRETDEISRMLSSLRSKVQKSA